MPVYTNKSILLASKHAKEQAIAGPFMDILSSSLVLYDFDTDKFGTFTGEIARQNNPYVTCLQKARTAADTFNYNLVVANEGSFGPHPSMPFLASDHEIMLLVDTENDLVISEQLVTQKTNYNMQSITKDADISDFLNRVKFPSHGLTLQNNHDKQVVAKGIVDKKTLADMLKLGFAKSDELLIGTDMRAMFNPTRMEFINTLALKLAKRIATNCQKCQTPGFGLQTTQGGLPCSLCSSPTSLFKEEVWGCIICSYVEHKPRADGLLVAEPTYCNYCNP